LENRDAVLNLDRLILRMEYNFVVKLDRSYAPGGGYLFSCSSLNDYDIITAIRIVKGEHGRQYSVEIEYMKDKQSPSILIDNIPQKVVDLGYTSTFGNGITITKLSCFKVTGIENLELIAFVKRVFN
jgi:hypothetical protein